MKIKNVFKISILSFCFSVSYFSFSQEIKSDIFLSGLPTSLTTSDLDFSLIAETNNEFRDVILKRSIVFNSSNDIANHFALTSDHFKELKKQLTFTDILNNYKKSELNKHFFKGYNMWDISPQEEYHKQNRN
jgi:hypothetical protein